MTRYWIQLGLIDTHLPLTADQRRQIAKDAYRHAWQGWGFRLKMIGACLALPLAVAACGYLFMSWLAPFGRIQIAAPIGMLSACSLCIIVFSRLISWLQRKAFRMALRDLGYDICVNCGYWLRGLGDNVHHCPECGSPRQPLAGPAAARLDGERQ